MRKTSILFVACVLAAIQVVACGCVGTHKTGPNIGYEIASGWKLVDRLEPRATLAYILNAHNICVSDVNGDDPKVVAYRFGGSINLAWSPDGRFLYYAPYGSNIAGIAVDDYQKSLPLIPDLPLPIFGLSAADSGCIRIYPEPDGKRLFCLRLVGRQHEDSMELLTFATVKWPLDRSSRDNKVETLLNAQQGALSIRNLDINFKRNIIVVVRGDSTVEVLDIQGHLVRNLGMHHDIGEFSILPDGSAIIYYAYAPSSTGNPVGILAYENRCFVKTLNLATGEKSTLFEGDAPCPDPTGRRVAYRRDGGLWLSTEGAPGLMPIIRMVVEEGEQSWQEPVFSGECWSDDGRFFMVTMQTWRLAGESLISRTVILDTERREVKIFEDTYGSGAFRPHEKR